MADQTPAEKAAEIIEKTPEGELEQSSETTQQASQEDKSAETSDKDAEGGEKLYADVFKTPDMLEKSTMELAKTLNMSTLNQKALRNAIAEAKESKDFSEVEAIYKEMQAEHTRSKQKSDTITEKKDEVVEEQEYAPLSEDERVTYLRGQVLKRLRQDPLVAKFSQKGVEFPKAEIGSSEWEDQMLELADSSPGLHSLLQSRVVALAREEVNWLEQYETTATGSKEARKTAEDEGRKYLTQINTDLSIGLTPDDMAGIISSALKAQESFNNQYGISVAKKNAVALYFNNNVLHGKVKAMIEQAKTEGALGQSKALQKMKEEAQQTAGKSKLSTEVDRRGKDAPKFDTHKGAESATPEQRERRIQEIIGKLEDKE